MGMSVSPRQVSVTFGGIEVPINSAFQLAELFVNQRYNSTHASLSATFVAVPNYKNAGLSEYSSVVPQITLSGCGNPYHPAVGPAGMNADAMGAPEKCVTVNKQKHGKEIDSKYVLPSLHKIKKILECKSAAKKNAEEVTALPSCITGHIAQSLTKSEAPFSKEYKLLQIVQEKICDGVGYAEKGDIRSLQRYIKYLLDIAENVDSLHFYASRPVKPEYAGDAVMRYREVLKLPEGTEIYTLFSDLLDDIGQDLTPFARDSEIKEYLGELENLGEKLIRVGSEGCVIIDSSPERYPQVPHTEMLPEKIIEKISAAETMSLASGLEKKCKDSRIANMVVLPTLFSAEQTRLAELLDGVKEPLAQEILAVAEELCGTAIENSTGYYDSTA